jgi:hypothetical protein
VHGLGERARPRAPSGAPRTRLVEEATGLRPHFFSTQPAGARAGAPEAGALPGTSALPRHFLRRSRLDPVAELETSFDGAWRGLASCSRNFKCPTAMLSGLIRFPDEPTCLPFYRSPVESCAFYSTRLLSPARSAATTRATPKCDNPPA